MARPISRVARYARFLETQIETRSTPLPKVIALSEETGELLFSDSCVAQETMQQAALESLMARHRQRLALRIGRMTQAYVAALLPYNRISKIFENFDEIVTRDNG